jgi:hypothetical protein
LAASRRVIHGLVGRAVIDNDEIGMKKKNLTKRETPQPQFPQVLETFRCPVPYWLGQISEQSPSCFNDRVQVRKYRVTVELIDEPKEAIAARIQKLWVESDNYHHREPLRRVADEYGVSLNAFEFGSKCPRKS